MASSSSLPTNPPQFLRVVLPPAFGTNKLRILQEFAKQFGHELTEAAWLTLPNGRVWQVQLKRKGEKIWFHNGWQDFLESLSISVGCFLVFRYEKYSSFHVHVFDLTGCEIEYPYDGGEPTDNEHGNEEPVQISEGKECEWQNKKRKKKEDVEEIDDTASSEDESDMLAILETKKIYLSKKGHRLPADDRKRIITIAKDFKSTNPSFLVFMRLCGKQCRQVQVPLMFVEEFVGKDVECVQIQISKERTETVGVFRRCNGSIFLSRGWGDISKAKDLKKGDICIFELVRAEDVLLKLHVIRK